MCGLWWIMIIAYLPCSASHTQSVECHVWRQHLLRMLHVNVDGWSANCCFHVNAILLYLGVHSPLGGWGANCHFVSSMDLHWGLIFPLVLSEYVAVFNDLSSPTLHKAWGERWGYFSMSTKVTEAACASLPSYPRGQTLLSCHQHGWHFKKVITRNKILNDWWKGWEAKRMNL